MYTFISTISLVLLTLHVLPYTVCIKKWLDCLLSQSEQRYKYWIKRTKRVSFRNCLFVTF